MTLHFTLKRSSHIVHDSKVIHGSEKVIISLFQKVELSIAMDGLALQAEYQET
jgi:uncharacterized membrane protein